ncbi:MAG: diaminopimelate epimerase [Coriobacteriia bacterium]
MELAFVKMHGLGNDFVVMEDMTEELELSAQAVEWFCDRNFGIGADGLILVRPSTLPEADFFMLYYNSDGTVAEMCGNGIRCLAKYVVDHGLVPRDQTELTIETLGGIKPITVTRADDNTMHLATVDMGVPVLEPAAIPTGMRGTTDDGVVISFPLETELGTYDVTPVSLGNPHCVLWVDDVETAPVYELGSLIENHPLFPNKTNVEFAQIVDRDTIRLRVWERGCGETLACGTGACAAAVVGSLTGRIGRKATIELPGGDLDIMWAENDHVLMTGPAEEVFSGAMFVGEDEDAE